MSVALAVPTPLLSVQLKVRMLFAATTRLGASAAINKVYNYDEYYCPSVTARMFKVVQRSKFNPEKKSIHDQYTERDKDIIRLICSEKSSDEISKELFISKRTVDKARVAIAEKMHAKTIVGVVLYAIKNFLYHIPDDPRHQ